ncbi:MAG: hypothetical protein ACRDYZ_02530 [Acidimicrobiales bacterium]
MTSEPATLEEALQGVERDADAALKSLTAALREAKRVKHAAAAGHIRDLEQSLDGAVRLADQALAATGEVRAGWQFDVGEWFANGEYAKELLAAAADAGVQAFESDERILCYPAIVQVSASDTAVMVDKKRERRVRPSVLVRHLAALQQRPPRFKPAAFIASLVAAYDLVVRAKGLRPGGTARLVDVYGALTLLPGASREYTRQEFARDLYLLDQSGVVDARDGRRMSLPASALTRSGGTLTTVSRAGQTKVYAGIAFDEPGR